MTGTIILTGANSSLAILAVEYLLTHFPIFTLVLTVRNDGDDNVHTKALRHVIGSLPQLAGIVCNACYWNLLGTLEMTDDGYEKSMQVCHLAHVALVLRLLNSFGPDGGRIVLFASDAHEPGKNNLEVIPPSIPTNPEKLELLVTRRPTIPPSPTTRATASAATSRPS
ncbi:hypothetical protein MFIFM68171_04881 [Madurella fahalii]|uniref:Ketoreductase (KR) domain-containing protein n=1 Tax=Madurella fahalii TaxID=1157608 RepID=A0ABQ0GA76_9PEZI